METLSKNKIKWIRSLRQKKNRIKENVFVVEGEKMVRELLTERSDQIVCLCTTDASIKTNVEAYLVDEKILKEISSLTTTNSMLAVVNMPTFKSKDADFILALDGIQDPGNMGTIIRTADWFGVNKIVCSKETVDVFNPKVVQSSMGSLFRVPVEYNDLADYISKSELTSFGALLSGESIYEQSLSKQGIIVIGNEGAGISPEVEAEIDKHILIPRIGGAESLNASVATGIILAEFCR